MGNFFGSVQVRSEDRDRVKAVAAQVAGATQSRMLVGPALAGWIGLYPENHGQDQSVGCEISSMTMMFSPIGFFAVEKQLIRSGPPPVTSAK
jgi:hypothetical protein